MTHAEASRSAWRPHGRMLPLAVADASSNAKLNVATVPVCSSILNIDKYVTMKIFPNILEALDKGVAAEGVGASGVRYGQRRDRDLLALPQIRRSRRLPFREHVRVARLDAHEPIRRRQILARLEAGANDVHRRPDAVETGPWPIE